MAKTNTLYTQTELDISIDSIKLVVYINITSNEHIDKLKMQLKHLGVSMVLNEHEWIISNKYKSSICKINNYLSGRKNICTDTCIISIFGMSQVYYNSSNIPQEHKIILQWAISYQAEIVSIDYAFDHHYGYDLSLSNYKNKSNILNQNKYNINYLSKFLTHNIYIPIQDNENLIEEIKKRSIDDIRIRTTVSKTNNYYQYVYLKDFLYQSFAKAENKKDATHIKLSIKDMKSFFIYKSIIEKHTNVEYSKSKIDVATNVLIENSKPAVDIISYDKYNRDKDNDNKFTHILKNYKEVAHRYNNISYKSLEQYRVEVRRNYNKYEMFVSIDTIDEIMELISNDIKEIADNLEITIFPSKNKFLQYLREIKKINNYKKRNKNHRGKVCITDYGRILNIDTLKIDAMINNLRECFITKN